MASKNFRSKKEVIYDELREEILKGSYKPGTRLVIDELAKELGVSQIPIREAIQQLEADGFVTVEPYVGARIARMDASFIYEVFALLESMEVICSRTACTVMTDEELETLSEMVSAMDDTLDDPIKWSEQNRELHLFICECAKTSLILKMMQKVFDHWERLRRHYLQDIATTRIKESQAEHYEMLDAIKKRDTDKVEQVIREHNQNALNSYTQHLQKEGHLEVEEG